MHRRAFLATLAAGAAAATAGCRRGAWAGAGARRLAAGVQLYTVRGAMRADVERTLDRVAQLGYREVEFAGYFGRTPAQVRAALAAAGLASPSTHVPLEAVSGDRLSQTLDAASAVGHRWVVVPWLAPAQRRTADDWRRVAETLNAAGRAARARGLRVGYHNHDFELERVTPDGRTALDVLLAETDPVLVALQLDVYWAVKAGADPLRLVEGGRVAMLHLKDTAGPPDHRMTDVGAGTIAWEALLRRAERSGVEHAFVEHDEPADPWASLAASRAGLRRVGV